MKKRLEIIADSPEDDAEIRIILNAVNLKIVIDDIRNGIRGKLKYESLSESQSAEWQKMRELVSECLSDNEVSHLFY